MVASGVTTGGGLRTTGFAVVIVLPLTLDCPVVVAGFAAAVVGFGFSGAERGGVVGFTLPAPGVAF